MLLSVLALLALLLWGFFFCVCVPLCSAPCSRAAAPPVCAVVLSVLALLALLVSFFFSVLALLALLLASFLPLLHLLLVSDRPSSARSPPLILVVKIVE